MKHITSFLSKRSFVFEWHDTMHTTTVKFVLPDLEFCDSQVWGDWGPMYEFKLNSNEPIIIWYNGQSSKSSQTSLLVESPILADQRTKTPFCILIEDVKKNLMFHIFVDQDFVAQNVDVFRLRDKVLLHQTSVREHRTLAPRSVPQLTLAERHLSYAE